MGDYAYNTLKWRNVVTIGDDYDFQHAERRLRRGVLFAWREGHQADLAAARDEGLLVYIAQIPKTGIDGFFLTVGGTGTVAFVKEYEQLQSGSLSGSSSARSRSTRSSWRSSAHGSSAVSPARTPPPTRGILSTGSTWPRP